MTGCRQLDAESIDCVVTSPPYYQIRDYGIDGQIGLEPTPENYIEKLIEIFSEIQRVLKADGTVFVNISDTYAGSNNCVGDKKRGDGIGQKCRYTENKVVKAGRINNVPNKSLLMIPYRFSWEMIQSGFILRNVIIWHKPNSMPSSAKDRFTNDYEPVFFFSKYRKYHFEQQLEPLKETSLKRSSYGWHGKTMQNGKGAGGIPQCYIMGRRFADPNGRNMRAVWSINTKSDFSNHFATFPEKLVARMIKAGCPKNGVVLDPFAGSNTTGITAKKLERNFIGFELNPEYIKISEQKFNKHIGMF